MRYLVLFIFIWTALSYQQPTFASFLISEENRNYLHTLNSDEKFQQDLQRLYTWQKNNDFQNTQVISAKNKFDEKSVQVRYSIRDIDANELAIAEAQLAHIKAKHEKLLATYKKLTQQYSALRPLKTSALKKTLQFEIDAIRPGVYLARSEINKYKKIVQKIKQIRNTKQTGFRKKWTSIQTKHAQLNIYHSKISLLSKSLEYEWKSLIKQKDRALAAASLSRCIYFSDELSKQKAIVLEQESLIIKQIDSLLKQM